MNLDKSIHVWHTSLEIYHNYYSLFQSWLSNVEKQRAKSMVDPKRQLLFVLNRGLLRLLLSNYSHVSPHQVQFSFTQLGKPRFTNDKKIEFNLSHSAQYAAYAFSFNDPVGIDLEYITTEKHLIHIDRIAYRYFSASDFAQIKCLRGRLKLLFFLKTWVHYEASLKAQAYALRTHKKSQYSIDRNTQVLSSEQEKMQLITYNLMLNTHLFAALAVRNTNKPIVVRALPDALEDLNSFQTPTS